MSYSPPTDPAPGGFFGMLILFLLVVAAVGIAAWVLSYVPGVPPWLWAVLVGVLALVALAFIARHLGYLR